MSGCVLLPLVGASLVVVLVVVLVVMVLVVLVLIFQEAC